MALPEGVADAILQSNKALAETLAGAFQNLKYQRVSSIKLCKFLGHPKKPGDQTITEWLADLNTYTRQVGLDDEEKLSTALDFLGGVAKEEVLCTPTEDRDSFAQLSALLVKRFGAPETVQSLTRALYSRTQLVGESLADFSRALIRLHDRMEHTAVNAQERDALNQLRESALKEQFCKGVRDMSIKRELRKLLYSQPDLSFSELREFALDMFPNTEQSCEAEDSTVDCDTAMALKAAAAPPVNGLSELIDCQKQLVQSMNKLVVQQADISSKIQSMSEGIETLVDAQRRSAIKCSFCHRSGHTAERCFKRKRSEDNKKSEPARNSAETPNSGNAPPSPQRAM